MIENYDDIMAQMPEEPVGEEGRVKPESLEPNVFLEVEEKEPTAVAWVAKGNKRQKVIQVPDKVK